MNNLSILKGNFVNAEDRNITDSQRRILTDLFYQNIQDEDKRESWLSQLDSMSEADANDTIFEFLALK